MQLFQLGGMVNGGLKDDDGEALQPQKRLDEIFAKMKIKGLPAMSGHVRELISLTQSSRSAAYELAQVILKDYSLTNKVLQVVNSAYYSLGRPVNSISKAVTILGFDAVRDLAMAIALFENFVKSGADKEKISRIMTCSFLSAMQARDLAVDKNLEVAPEEAFICATIWTRSLSVSIFPRATRGSKKWWPTGLTKPSPFARPWMALTTRRSGLRWQFFGISPKMLSRPWILGPGNP